MDPKLDAGPIVMQSNDMGRLTPKSPYFVALDVPTCEQALHVANACQGLVRGFKVGPRLCFEANMDFYQQLAQFGPLFIDHKFLDIPNTMKASVQACFDAGASYVTVHAGAGFDALSLLAKLEAQLNELRPFKILAVTVLTSLKQGNLPSHWRPQSITEHVLSLASDCDRAGLRGLVCSTDEVSLLRKNFSEYFLLVPGIRLEGDDRGDQSRVAGPKQALNLGASALVLGRPIVESSDPRSELLRYLRAIDEKEKS